jgi:hypothetical protein
MYGFWIRSVKIQSRKHVCFLFVVYNEIFKKVGWIHGFLDLHLNAVIRISEGHRCNIKQAYSLHYDGFVPPKRIGKVHNRITKKTGNRKDLLTPDQSETTRKLNQFEIYKSMRRAIDGLK